MRTLDPNLVRINFDEQKFALESLELAFELETRGFYRYI